MNLSWFSTKVNPKQFVVDSGTFLTSAKLQAEGFFPFELAYLYENEQFRQLEYQRNMVDFSIFALSFLDKSDTLEEEVK